MDINTKITEQSEQKDHGGMVHFVLSHSYTVFLIAVVLGLIFDVLIPLDTFNGIIYQYAGVFMIIIGSALIYWAQSVTSSSKNFFNENGVRNFEIGPYKYSRNPTHIGLSIMTLGLGFVLNSVFSVLFIAIASVVTKFIFLKKEEALLEKKYGQAYLDYKKKVGTWV